MSIPRRLLAATVATAAAVALSGCSSDAPSEAAAADTPGTAGAEEVTITHAQGESTVPVNPERVVVLDMGALDTIQALGVDSVVGLPKANVPEFLSEYEDERYTDVGTLAEPDYEAINALDPDLVIVGFRSAPAYAELAEHWDVVDVSFEQEDFLAGFAESAGILGEIFDSTEEVDAALAEIDAKAQEVRDLAADAGTAMVVSTSGGEVTAYGPQSRFGPIFTELGMAEAMTDVEDSPHGEAISFELIRDTNPDWLFVNDRDAVVSEGAGQAAEQVLDNELVAATTAWQEDQVVYLDPARWYLVMHGTDNVLAMFTEVGEALAR